jgi:hypothetical protein
MDTAPEASGGACQGSAHRSGDTGRNAAQAAPKRHPATQGHGELRERTRGATGTEHQAVWISYSDCGGASEADYGEGRETEAALTERFLGGAPYSNSGVSLRWLETRDADAFSFGAECNREFRGRFAAALAAGVSEDQLREAWRYLDARLRPSFAHGGLSGTRDSYEHLVAFRGKGRVPPVHWVLSHPILFGEVTRYVRKAAAGRAIDVAAARFWNENAALGDDRSACPATMARLDTARANIQALLAKEWPRAAKD